MSQAKLDEARDANFSKDFITKMENRILVGYFKYGHAKANAVTGDFPACVKERVDKYLATGNTEWLIDTANFAMLEFMYPQHGQAHFAGTDSDQSPGVVMRDGSRWYGKAGKD